METWQNGKTTSYVNCHLWGFGYPHHGWLAQLVFLRVPGLVPGVLLSSHAPWYKSRLLALLRNCGPVVLTNSSESILPSFYLCVCVCVCGHSTCMHANKTPSGPKIKFPNICPTCRRCDVSPHFLQNKYYFDIILNNRDRAIFPEMHELLPCPHQHAQSFLRCNNYKNRPTEAVHHSM